MNYKEGDAIVLEDGIEYIIVYLLKVRNHHYGLLMTAEEVNPTIKIGTFVTENDQMIFKTTKNREQAMYILESILHQAQ